jgi:hypothetical protein
MSDVTSHHLKHRLSDDGTIRSHTHSNQSSLNKENLLIIPRKEESLPLGRGGRFKREVRGNAEEGDIDEGQRPASVGLSQHHAGCWGR